MVSQKNSHYLICGMDSSLISLLTSLRIKGDLAIRPPLKEKCAQRSVLLYWMKSVIITISGGYLWDSYVLTQIETVFVLLYEAMLFLKVDIIHSAREIIFVRRKMEKFIFLIILWANFFIFLFPGSVSGKTYYVSKNGNDRNPGTAGSPWLTIQKAADTLRPGDTVLIRQGDYQEKVTPARSGTEGNYITYSNYPSEDVVIDAQDGKRNACIRVDRRKFLRFIGLRLTGASGASGLRAGFHASDESGNLLLEKITADNNRFGILLHGKYAPVSHVIIRNCTANGNTGHGIFLYRKVYDTTIGPQNHVFSNAGEKYAFGIEIGTDYPGNQINGARDITVYENEIDHNGMQGIRTWNAMNVLIRKNHCHYNGATGIQIEDGSENIIVENNLCEYNAQTYEYETGIWIDSTRNAVVTGNYIRGNKIGLMVTDSSRVILRRNVVVENNRGVPHLLNAMGLNINTNTYSVAVVHNTFFRNGAAESTKGGISMCSHPPVEGVIFKNNIFSEAKASYDLWIGCVGYVSDYNIIFNTRNLAVNWQHKKLSWTQYLGRSGQESHSMTEKPLFVGPGVGDFHLERFSPGIDRGDCLTRTSGAGKGNVLKVENASFFSYGFGVIAGDYTKVGTNKAVRITNVDYENNTITLEKSIAWSQGDGVSYPYTGSSPDMGAYELSENDSLPPAPPSGWGRRP
jgi:parallel beta-helix repeat protein